MRISTLCERVLLTCRAALSVSKGRSRNRVSKWERCAGTSAAMLEAMGRAARRGIIVATTDGVHAPVE